AGEGRVRGVLLADDDAGLRQLLRTCVASDRYPVLGAADGLPAWELLPRDRPAGAGLGGAVPCRAGRGVARLIKGDPGRRRTDVILLTALATGDDAAVGYAAGADLYLTKPFSPLELLEAVERALGAA